MKALKLCEANAAAIEAALKEVNGRATEHVYTRFTELLGVTAEAENRALRLLGLKKHLPGLTVRAMSGGSVARAYRNARRTTRVTIELRGKNWYLTEIAQSSLYADQVGFINLRLTQAQDAAAVALLRSHYSVQRPAAQA